MIENIVDIVNFSQDYIKNNLFEWSVSLRDVSRFLKIYEYFLKEQNDMLL
jgi:hypothetical protein